MKTKLFIAVMLVCCGLYGQRITPEQIKKETGSDKQKVLMSDATTGVYHSTSDGMVLPYDTQRGVDGDYDVNDIVTFGGYLYRSQTNNNVSTPGVGTWELLSSSGGTESIGPTVTIRRVPQVGDVISATTPGEFINWHEFVAPTLTLNFTPVNTFYEVGTSTAITISGTVSNPAGATLSLGDLRQISPSSISLDAFGAGTSYSAGITFTPQQGGSGGYNEFTYQFRASQAYSEDGGGTSNSQTLILESDYPYFAGVGSTNQSSVTSDIYGTLTKYAVREGSHTVLFSGTGLLYYCIPNTWSDTVLSSIKDANNLENIGNFNSVQATITSTGLTNNYTAEPCTCYISNQGSGTYVNFELTFNQ